MFSALASRRRPSNAAMLHPRRTTAQSAKRPRVRGAALTAEDRRPSRPQPALCGRSPGWGADQWREEAAIRGAWHACTHDVQKVSLSVTMFRKFVTPISIAASPTVSYAQVQESIPAEVIEECNAQSEAHELPDCLKSGAVAFEMIAIAQMQNLYGDSAKPVLEVCAGRNKTFASTWTCFETAAFKASEARALIGFEGIEDACVAGISDPDLYARIETIYSGKVRDRFPDRTYFGGGSYWAPRFSTVLVPPRRRAWSEAGGRASAVALLRPDGRGAAAFTLGFFCLAA